MPWLLDLVYLAVVTVASPVLLYRRLQHGKYRAGWGEKLLGSVPELAPAAERVWFHAVSVGEVLLLRGSVADLRSRQPDVDVVLTTTTSTGYDLARKQYPDLTVCYCPLDFSWAVRRAIGRLKPTALVLAELELWPNLVLAASAAGVRLAIVNGRLSEKSFRGYRKLRPLVAGLLRRFDLIAVQGEDYAARFRALGAPTACVVTTGSVKFDGARGDSGNTETAELRRAFGIADGEAVLIAGSTQHPEEEYALATWQELLPEFPNLRLILVPRHKERFEDVAELVRRSGLPLVRRSGPRPETEGQRSKEKSAIRNPHSAIPPVLLLDTLGELGACWGLADVAFVGGSLTDRGGQNMIEPAAYGAAVLFGPNTRNFRDAVALLLSAEAARVVRGPGELTAEVRRFLGDRNLRRAYGKRAQTAVAAHRGATARTTELLLSRVLSDTGESRRRGAA
jgi:3-deoxy-D-manno-octulosonic-acid transferase